MVYFYQSAPLNCIFIKVMLSMVVCWSNNLDKLIEEQFTAHSPRKVDCIIYIKRYSHTQAKLAHTAGAYPGFRIMKPTRSIATPPGWDASPLQVTPQHFVANTYFILVGRERHCESSVLPKNTTQWPQRSSPDHSIRSPSRQPLGHHVYRDLTVLMMCFVL